LVFLFQTCRAKGQDDEQFNSLLSLFFLFLSYKGEGHNNKEPNSSLLVYFSSWVVLEP
jgi:hypothetical protein